ncbi:MAG: FapA family protein, partial [Treponema sp.]|nr:FapA family protein [Treponema sp.]
AKSSWEIHTGTDGVTLFFTFRPGDPRFPVPKGADIIAEAKKDNPADFIPPEEIDRAIGRSMKTRAPVLALPLFKTREAEAGVNVSPDLLRAELILRKGVAGARPLEMKAISQAIRDSGVKGFNAEELKAAIKSFMEGSGVALVYVLAEGKAASRGTDRNVELLAKPVGAEEKAALLKRLASYNGAEGFPCSEADMVCVVEKDEKAALVTPGGDGEEGLDVYGRVIPGLPGNDPEIKIFRGLRMHGSDIIAETGGLLLVKGIRESAGKDTEEHSGNPSGGSFFGTVIEYRDAKAVITISPDAMRASAELYGSIGPGLPLDPELVMKSLAAAGVTTGIDQEAVETACKLASLKGNASAVLARGRPASSAGSQVVTWLIPAFAAGPSHGARTCPVIRGQALAELSTAAAEVKGFDVSGKALEPDAAGPELAWDETVIAAADGEKGKRLTAKTSGELCFTRTSGGETEKLSIRSLKEIRGDVGKETGNVTFSGELRIAGKVNPGCSVIGGKDVLVGGSADAALISAGGKAVIVRGINGGGRGVVRARNSIEAAFAENATLLAVEDIRLQSRCEGCTVKTNGRVITGGKLSGGICKSRKGISAAELGADRSKRTEISFGQDYLIKDQIEAGEREIEKINAALDATEIRIKKVLENGSSALQAAREEKVRLLKLREQYRLKVFTLRERFEEHHDSEIAIKGAVYPGVVMESHDRYYEIFEKRSGVVFFFDRDSGRIKERPIKD